MRFSLVNVHKFGQNEIHNVRVSRVQRDRDTREATGADLMYDFPPNDNYNIFVPIFNRGMRRRIAFSML